MKPYTPIDCGDYDYIEIACMDRYEVDVIARDDRLIHGVAVDTETNDTGEYLILQTPNNGSERVRVDQIRRIVVRSENRRFDERRFEG